MLHISMWSGLEHRGVLSSHENNTDSVSRPRKGGLKPDVPRNLPENIVCRASPISIAQLLGHASVGIVMTYAKSTDEARRDAIQKLEQFRQLHTTERTDTLNVQTVQ